MVKGLPGGTGGSKLAGLGRLILAVQPASYFREAAVSTRQSLAISALSLANQANQGILQFLR
ncbi:hypothetical protein [Methylorubrum salsuginis]|uniref:Flagellin C-terminal helical region n=1 Tax=Methylorubrum salsuginis TaxID=414703 RepID=A0A1I4KMY7_9HYPH|nr:hypothetical protein [Methylorubrum salsuginis]SFL79906.1 hypothetical protein SAMN04488125_12516 [Methylorubrum salsuginis]